MTANERIEQIQAGREEVSYWEQIAWVLAWHPGVKASQRAIFMDILIWC